MSVKRKCGHPIGTTYECRECELEGSRPVTIIKHEEPARGGRSMPQVRVIFRDRNPAVASAMAVVAPESWNVACGDIFSVVPADFVLSPANTIGRMDGGIDLIYTHRFGHQIELRLMRDIKMLHGGKLPIGKAHAITTYDPLVPMMISAPTMDWPPGDVSNSDNAYRAFKAALHCAIEVGQKVNPGQAPTIITPGLCTLTGRMPPHVCAEQMVRAWKEVTS